MAIHLRPTPVESKLALTAGLADFLQPHERLRGELREGKLGLPVLSLSLDEIAGGATLAGAHEVGWQFLAGGTEGNAMAALIAQLEEGGPQALASVASGHEISLLLEAMDKANALDATFEPWLLKVPGILLEALWLKSTAGGEDLVLPFHTKSRQLLGKDTYTSAEFMGVIKSMVESFRPFDDLDTEVTL